MLNTAIDSLLTLVEKHDIDINFGLAPNPFGFTFISTGDKRVDRIVSDLLKEIELNNKLTIQLRKVLYG